MRKWMSPAVLIVLCTICILASCRLALAADDAQAMISVADSNVQSAYNKILLAEEAGANVSELVSKLNTCASLLSQAHMGYRAGNLTEALNLASQCNVDSEGIEAEADSLHDQSVSHGRQRILFSGAMSAVAIMSLVLVSVLSWRLFKKWYSGRFMRLRPEVKANEPR